MADNVWSKEKKGKEADVAVAADLADAARGGASLSANMITRAALVESAKAMAERKLAGTWLASLTRIAHSLAIAGCLNDGGLAVASGYLWVTSTLLAQHGLPFAIMYDDKLRRLACETEETTVEDIRRLFHERNPNVVSEVVADLESTKSQRVSQPQQEQQQQQRQQHQRQPRSQRPRQQPPAAARGASAAVDKRPREFSAAPLVLPPPPRRGP